MPVREFKIMSDSEDTTDDRLFSIDRAKRSRAICKICKKKCLTGEIRIAKYVTEVLAADRKKHWYHVDCIFEQFLKKKFLNIRIESPNDMDGWSTISERDQRLIEEKIRKSEDEISKKYGLKNPQKIVEDVKNSVSNIEDTMQGASSSGLSPNPRDHCQSFKSVCLLLRDLGKASENFQKSCLISKMFFTRLGMMDVYFRDDLKRLMKLIVPDFETSVPFSIGHPELITIFRKLFSDEEQDEIPGTASGDIATMICNYAMRSKKTILVDESNLILKDVVEFLDEVRDTTDEEDRFKLFEAMVPKCTAHELRVLLQFVSNSIVVGVSVKNVLDILHSDAFQFYQTNPNMDAVYKAYLFKPYPLKPILPVLVSDVRSVGEAMYNCISGMICEVSYDGERIHMHRRNDEIRYYLVGKIARLATQFKALPELVYSAVPYPHELILDCHILTRDVQTMKPIKTGTYTRVNLTCVVSDCMYMDGDFTKKPLKRRRQLLAKRFNEIPPRISLSEQKEILRVEDFNEVISTLMEYDFGGLYFKDRNSFYKTRQTKTWHIPRRYFNDTKISLDLIVLGAWYEIVNEVRKPTLFLMGCHDRRRKMFRTVVRVRAANMRLKENNLEKIDGDCSKMPEWFRCYSQHMVPEYIAKDPKAQPVWRVTAIELIFDSEHSANQISMLYPKVVHVFPDKNWKHAVDISSLQKTYDAHNAHLKGLPKPGENPVFTRKSTKPPPSSGSSQKKKTRKDSEAGPSRPSRPSTSFQAEETFEELKPIPQYFKNIRLCLEYDMVGRHTHWVKCFEECGGIIVDQEQADYLLHYEDTYPQEKMHFWKRDLIHVIVEWIRDTVRKGALQDDRPYRVTLLPYGYVEGQPEVPMPED